MYFLIILNKENIFICIKGKSVHPKWNIYSQCIPLFFYQGKQKEIFFSSCSFFRKMLFDVWKQIDSSPTRKSFYTNIKQCFLNEEHMLNNSHAWCHVTPRSSFWWCSHTPPCCELIIVWIWGVVWYCMSKCGKIKPPPHILYHISLSFIQIKGVWFHEYSVKWAISFLIFTYPQSLILPGWIKKAKIGCDSKASTLLHKFFRHR